MNTASGSQTSILLSHALGEGTPVCLTYSRSIQAQRFLDEFLPLKIQNKAASHECSFRYAYCEWKKNEKLNDRVI